MRGTRTFAAALLVASLALAGCGANDDAGGSAADAKGLTAEKPADAGAEAARDGAPDAAPGGGGA
ncbi:DUF4349 domain-containing protein, partial [Streptomyces sp. NPDC048629]